MKSLLKQPVEAKASAAQLGQSLLANGGKGSAEYGMRNQQSVEFEYGALLYNCGVNIAAAFLHFQSQQEHKTAAAK